MHVVSRPKKTLEEPRPMSNSTAYFRSTGEMRCASVYFERGCPEQRPRGAGGAALVAPKQAARGRPKRPPWRREKKNAPPPRATPAITPETAKSPREIVRTFSSPWGLLAMAPTSGTGPKTSFARRAEARGFPSAITPKPEAGPCTRRPAPPHLPSGPRDPASQTSSLSYGTG
jgi:hypothetical protein